MVTHDELWTLIKLIPAGQVSSYGELGRALRNPVSGLLVGRWMKGAPEGIPWWRVVGKDGSLLIGRESPQLAFEQEERLKAEGVTFEGGRVTTAAFVDLTDLLA